MTTNEQIIDEINTIRREIIPRIDDNTDRLDYVQPLVENHQRVLYGDPLDRKDGGMITAFNSMEDLFRSVKNWAGKLVGTSIAGVLFWIARNLFEMYVAYQQIVP